MGMGMEMGWVDGRDGDGNGGGACWCGFVCRGGGVVGGFEEALGILAGCEEK